MTFRQFYQLKRNKPGTQQVQRAQLARKEIMEGKLLFNPHLRRDGRDRERPSLAVPPEAGTLGFPV